MAYNFTMLKFLANVHKSDLGKPKYLKYTEDKLIGPPRASDRYTVQEFTAMGYVGVYRKPIEMQTQVVRKQIKS